VQGNCTTPADNVFKLRYPSLLPTRLGQCLLLIQGNLFEARKTKLWIHNLYFRSNASLLTPANAAFAQPFGMLAVSHSSLYLSSVTFQGELTPANGSVVRTDLNMLQRRTQPVSMGVSDTETGLSEVLMTGAPLRSWACFLFGMYSLQRLFLGH
jgi:hypothetical protein